MLSNHIMFIFLYPQNFAKIYIKIISLKYFISYVIFSFLSNVGHLCINSNVMSDKKKQFGKVGSKRDDGNHPNNVDNIKK